MEKITSFTIDHIRLQPGVYVSRYDAVGAETVTTFDLRLTSPNEEPVMNTAEVHTIEHLAATYLRNEPTWKERFCTLAPWAAGRDFIFCWRETIQAFRFWTWFAAASPLLQIMRGKSPEPVPGTAATIWT